MKRKLIWTLSIVGIALLAFSVYLLIEVRKFDEKIQAARFLADSTCFSLALSNYVNIFGKIAASNNADLVASLNGRNSRQMVLLNLRARQINSSGEYVDYWNTPCDIKIMNQSLVSIRSAGKNRLFGDKDDLFFVQIFSTNPPSSNDSR